MINAVELEASAEFLHEFSLYQTKQLLVYDLEEPFRWLIDTSVFEAFRSGRSSRKDAANRHLVQEWLTNHCPPLFHESTEGLHGESMYMRRERLLP